MEFELLRKIIAGRLGVDISEIKESTSFADDLCADSLDMVEIIMSVEEELDMEIPDNAVKDIVTVGDAINAIRMVKD